MKKLLIIATFLLPFNLFGGWTLQESSVDGTLHDVHFVDTRHGWIAAGNENGKGLILRTTNGGKNWGKVYTDTNQSLLAVGFFDSLEGWAGGRGPTYVYDNGHGRDTPAILLRSVDGGKTWGGSKNTISSSEPQFSSAYWHKYVNGEDHYWQEYVDRICIVDSTYGFYMINGFSAWVGATFSNWVKVRSLNGAHFWQEEATCWWMWGLGLCFIDSLHGWVLEWPAKVLYTNTGIESLSVICDINIHASGGSEGLVGDMDFVDSLRGWIVYDTNYISIICHTVNGGSTWVVQESGVASRLYTVDFLDSLNGWVAGNNGTILRTRDGGNNWIIEDTPISSKINSICFVDTSHGWAIGDSGKILRYTSYGVEESEKLQVKGVKLMIEPNPFRNYAIINYELPVGSKVSLKIYDVMGRVVKVLVDGEVLSGYHKVEWNAEKFPSGIYFANLVAPNYKTSKKLILTK